MEDDLADMKSKKKHATLLMKGKRTEDRVNPKTGSLRFVPYKGKPCLWLLGRRDHALRGTHKLSAGDVFGVGHALVRVLFVGLVGASGAVEVTEDDGSKFGRARKKAEKPQRGKEKVWGNATRASIRRRHLFAANGRAADGCAAA